MPKLNVSSEWWTAPTESEDGHLIIVTGRSDIDHLRRTGKYNVRIEITWLYTPAEDGMPDYETSSLMEKVTDTLNATFDSDPVGIMTGIYTGDSERNWIFYCISVNIFCRKLNEALSAFETLPISLSAYTDPKWCEYDEMTESRLEIGE